MHWDHHKCIFSVDSLMVIIFFYSLCPTVHLTVFSPLIPPVWLWSHVNHCHSKHSVALHSAVSMQTEGEAPSVLIYQSVLGHVFAKLRSSNLFKHPLYRIHSLSLISLFSLIFAFPVATYLKAHLSLCLPTVASMLSTKSHDATLLFSFFYSFPRAPHTNSYDLCWTLNFHFHRIIASSSF